MNFARVDKLVDEYSVGHGTITAILPGEVVVILPEPTHCETAKPASIRLDEAFALARTYLEKGERVRLVATGASLSSCWPEWIEKAENFVTTEWGAYRAVHPIEASRNLSQQLHRWLGEVVGELPHGQSASESLYASACNRFLQPLFEAMSYTSGLASAHPSAVFHCVDSHWAGLEDLRMRVTARGGRVIPSGSEAKRWHSLLVFRLITRWIKAVAGQINLYIRSNPSRKRLRSLGRPGSVPLWIGLHPNWPRINRHVLDELEESSTQPFGVVLTSSLVTGDMTSSGGEASLWPGIPEKIISGDKNVLLDQMAGPGSVRELLNGLVMGSKLCLAASHRVLRHDNGLLRIAGGSHMSTIIDGLSRLLTVDLLQAVIIANATRSFVRRRQAHDSTVVFAILNVVDTAAANSVLKDEGVTTVDFRHGSGGMGWFGYHETFPTYSLGRSQIDTRQAKMLNRKPLRVPVRVVDTERRRRKIKNVLVLSGYSHESWKTAGFPLQFVERELLRGVHLLASNVSSLDVLWRPHPGDDQDQIDDRMKAFTSVALSKGTSLSQDLEWADLVITYGGSTLSEAIRCRIPVIVHALPSIISFNDIDAIGEDRHFFYAEQLLEIFERIADDAETAEDDSPVISAEKRLYEEFFGDGRSMGTVYSLNVDAIGKDRFGTYSRD